ncbi:MAG: nitroreductase family protein [Parasporobacterium sp.]|nr:nitroreductase family protein [Parasporobacterium sp.]
MNESVKTIMNRKSVRNYSPEAVKPEDLKAIAESAIWAPNAMNRQLWHITAVSCPELIAKMNEGCRQGMLNGPVPPLRERAQNPDFHAFFKAPAVIVISVPNEKFAEFNAGAAAENICLTAAALGYGTCVTASTGFMFAGDPDLTKDLDIPEGYEFICAITLGKEADGPDDHVRDRNYDVISYR